MQPPFPPRKRPAPGPRRGPHAPACEPLEPRRLLAAEVISLAAGGASTGNGPSGEFLDLTGGAETASIVSDDGRFVAFESRATNLVPGVTPDGSGDVYVRDRATGSTLLVSAGADGAPAGHSYAPSLSGDGRYVAFASLSLTILPGLRAAPNLFVRDTQTGVTTLVNRTPAGEWTAGNADFASISRNGRYVVFFGNSTEMVPGSPMPADGGIFRFDVQTGAVQPVTEAIEAGPDVTALPDGCSDDGNVVAFEVFRPHPTEPGAFAITGYVKDMTTGITSPATVTSDGRVIEDDLAVQMQLSGDGRHVVFETEAKAADNDINSASDLYVRDLVAGTTTLVSVGPDGKSIDPEHTDGNHLTHIGLRSISADGQVVVFESDDEITPDSDAGQPGPAKDVFARDLAAGTTRLLSPNFPASLFGESAYPVISADGRYAAFYDDRTGPSGVGAFSLAVVHIATGQEVLANEMPGGGAFDAESQSGSAFSRGGNLLVFAGFDNASKLVPAVADTNNATDLFAFPLEAAAGLDVTPAVVTSGVMPSAPEKGDTSYDVRVSFTDETRLDVGSLGTGDVVVTGPNGYRRTATFVASLPAASDTFRIAAYRVTAPGGVFDAAANGTYSVELMPNEVKDAAGNAAPAGPIPGATFVVDIPLGDGPDLQAVALRGAVPPAVVAGARQQKLKPLLLTVTNAGNQPVAGAVTIRVVASADDLPDAGDATLAELPGRKLKLAPGKSKVFKLKPAAFPAVADGDYRLLAVLDPGAALAERLESNNAAALPAPVRIATPFSDVGIASPALPGRLVPGGKATLVLTVRNDGNQPIKGVQPVRLRLTFPNAGGGSGSMTTDTFTSLKLNLKPGESKVMRGPFVVPKRLIAAEYGVTIELLSDHPWTDADPTDDVVGSAFTIPLPRPGSGGEPGVVIDELWTFGGGENV